MATRPPDPRRWTILAILCGSLVLVVVSVSSLNVAIPPIQSALGASGSELQWIIDSYALVFAGLLLRAGALGDRYGRRGTLLTGLTIFGVASIGGMVADSATELIVWRGVMGGAAALIMPAILSILTAVFPIDERPRAIAIWAGFAGAGGVVGLISSGVLLRSFWWGSVFAVNVPIIVVMTIAVIAVVPTSKDPDSTPLDPIGGLLSMIGLAALVVAVIEGADRGWFNPITTTTFVASVVVLSGFVAWEIHTDNPMLDPRFFSDRRFSLGSIVITASFFGIFAMFFVLTQFLQFVQGHDALGAGLRILPYGVVLLVVSPRAAALATRHGGRRVMLWGMSIAAGGFGVIGTLEADTPYALTAAGIVTIAIGTGLLMAPATALIVQSLPEAKAGVGSAMNDTTREVGGALGIAVGGALLSIGYRNGIEDEVGSLPPEASEQARDSLGGLLARPEAAELAELGRRAFTDGMQLAMLGAAGLVAGTALLVARLSDDNQLDPPGLETDFEDEPPAEMETTRG